MSQENVEIVRSLYDAWNDGDPGWSFYAADIEWDVSRWAPDLPDVARGQKEVRRLFQRFLGMWGEVRFEPERFIEHDDQVVVILTVQARGRESGVSVAARAA